MNTLRIQGTRFIVVGLLSNSILYLLYLLATTLGLGHKTAMTLLYITGILQTFVFNKTWTFSHIGKVRTSFIRYLAAYGFGYLLNLAVLALFVDLLGYPHAVVQAIAILIVATQLFLLQKYWVFPGNTTTRIQTSRAFCR